MKYWHRPQWRQTLKIWQVKATRHQRSHIIWFHSYGRYRLGKSIEMKNRLLVVRLRSDVEEWTWLVMRTGFLSGWWKCPRILVVIDAWIYQYTKCPCTVSFKWVNCMVHELYLNKAVVLKMDILLIGGLPKMKIKISEMRQISRKFNSMYKWFFSDIQTFIWRCRNSKQ